MLALALLLVAGVLGVVAAVLGTRAAGIHASLPAMPALAGRPPYLIQAVRDADRAARSWMDPLSGAERLGKVYHANGYTQEATACWTLLARTSRDDARWTYYLADLARNSGDGEAMAEHLHTSLRIDPHYAPGWLRLAEFLFKTGRMDEAAQAYRRRLDLVAGDPYARLGLARIALQDGRADDGKQLLASLVKDAPTFASAQNLYAEVLAESGDESGAKRHRALGLVAERFREADDPRILELRDHCQLLDQLLLWASQERQTNRTDQAVALLQRAIALDPANALAYGDYGQLLVETGRFDEARAVLEQGIHLAPFHPKSYLWLSEALCSLNQPQEALANDRRALTQAPDSGELLNSLGQSQVALGRIAEAEQSFLAATQRTPSLANPHTNLAMIYAQTGRRDQAREALERALQANPGSSGAAQKLGVLLLEEKRFDEAERVLRPYFEQNPTSATARALWAQMHISRAVAAVEADDPFAAEQHCAAGLRDVPESADLHGLRGQLRWQRGDTAGAIESMEACRRILPGDVRAVVPLVAVYRETGRPADARRVLLEAKAWMQAHGKGKEIGPIDSLLQSLPER